MSLGQNKYHQYSIVDTPLGFLSNSSQIVDVSRGNALRGYENIFQATKQGWSGNSKSKVNHITVNSIKGIADKRFTKKHFN